MTLLKWYRLSYFLRTRDNYLTRFAARLAYDGTNYQGFQRQRAGTSTIQSSVEDALQSIAGQHITCFGAGRTDTGVHASGQVIAWDMDWQHSIASLQKAMNSHLPPDIALQTIIQTDDTFHPRFSAQSRTYRYRIVITPARDPLRSRFTWQRFQPLAVEHMTEAAQILLGQNDFATFGQPPQGTNTIRHIMRSDIQVNGDEIWYIVTANAFLQRMVRSIVGTLVEVGRGKMTLNDFRLAFSATDRAKSGPSAPAQGLTLINVAYGNPDVQQQLSLFDETGLSEFAERPKW